MQMIDGRTARKILIDAGIPRDLTDAIAWHLIVPENVVKYAMSLWTHGMRAEQIKTIFGNSNASANILNVHRFFSELGPLAAHFGFTKEQIIKDIMQFDDEMEKYAHETIGARGMNQMYQHIGMIKDRIKDMVDMCAAGNGRFYRAGIEFIAWRKEIYESNEKISAVLTRCITSEGINIKRLLRLTTGYPGYGGNNVVSRTDGENIKPKIRMQNIQYACDVFRFFGENAGIIRNITQRYTDVEFISAFYELCMNWMGGASAPTLVEPKIPGYKTNLRDGVELVMESIVDGLPTYVRQMIINIALHEFAKIVPNAKYDNSR
jgi:hypothetical protein